MKCPVHMSWTCGCRLARANRLAAACLLLTGCGLLPAEAPEVDPCAAEIVKLEGLRTAEIVAKCQGQSFDNCLPTIDSLNAKYDPLIAEAIRCGAER